MGRATAKQKGRREAGLSVFSRLKSEAQYLTHYLAATGPAQLK